MQPSSYQQAVIDWVRDGRGHAVIEACAGGAKTTTLVLVAKELSSGIAVCFGREAKAELARRFEEAGVTNVVAQTVHSLGLATLRHEFNQVEVSTDKYWPTAKQLLANARVPYKDLAPKQLIKMFDFMRLNMERPSADHWERVVAEHDLDIDFDPAQGAELCTGLWEYGLANKKVVDYTDMLWLGVTLGLRGKKYDWVLVDEAQDISRLQYALIRQMMARDGRALFVGDRRQAIFHFAGADGNSFEHIVQDLGATQLPLSVCYRCPTSVLAKAREWCPQIEARPGAEQGTVRSIRADDLESEVQAGDMVLCRYTAPLVTLCYSLIAQGTSATVRGRDIGQGLIALVKKACGDDLSMGVDRLRQEFSALMVKEERKAMQIDNELAREQLLSTMDDKRQCLTAVLRYCDGHSAADVVRSIGELFSDQTGAVVCSTIHRAKGLENDRVFCLWPCVSKRATTIVQRQQETNIQYIAITRAKKELIFVLTNE